MWSEMHLRGYFPQSDLNQNARWPLPRQPQTFELCSDLSYYAKEQFRQTILKHESMFRHQVYELHRLYKVQREMTREMRASRPQKETMVWQSSYGWIAERLTMFEEHESFESKCRKLQRTLFDLENPSDTHSRDGFPQIGNGKGSVDASGPSLKRKIFGIEIPEANGSRSNPSPSQQNADSIASDLPGCVPCLRVDQSSQLPEKMESSSSQETGSGQISRKIFGVTIGLNARSNPQGKLRNGAESSRFELVTDLNSEPISPETKNQCRSRIFIDLNLSVEECRGEDEEDHPEPIGLMNPIGNETEKVESLKLAPNQMKESSQDLQKELITIAAEALVSISSSSTFAMSGDTSASPSNPLLWFAELVSSSPDAEVAPVDEFEYATLNLPEEEHRHDLPVYRDPGAENFARSQRGRGQRKRNFRRDVLRSIACLSRNEASCDLETIQGLVEAGGRTWRSSSVARRNSGKRSGEAVSKRKEVGTDASAMAPSPDLRGKKIRRPPRQRRRR